jgi:hypothetical protein
MSNDATQRKPVQAVGWGGWGGGASSVPRSEDAVEHVVQQLNGLCKSATMSFAIAVGRLVIDHLYAGDVQSWRARSPKKDHSLRKLARHPGLPLSAGALYRSIAIFEVCERLGLESWKHVSTAHVRLVLPLPPEAQGLLLHEAEQERWTAQRLDAEVVSLVRRDPSVRLNRGGRKRVSPLGERVRAVEKMLKRVEEILVPGDDAGLEPSPDSARRAVDVIRRAMQACGVLEARLERYAGAATTPPPPLGLIEDPADDD